MCKVHEKKNACEVFLSASSVMSPKDFHLCSSSLRTSAFWVICTFCVSGSYTTRNRDECAQWQLQGAVNAGFEFCGHTRFEILVRTLEKFLVFVHQSETCVVSVGSRKFFASATMGAP